MFHYYGSKNKIAKYYPKPQFGKIIEPFAGAAAYSLLYSDKNVVLNEKFDVIYDIWNWLINSADSQFIKNNANFYASQDISGLNLPEEYKDLVGFCINRGSAAPRNVVQRWSCQVKSKPDWASTTWFKLNKIANNLGNIRHWQVLNNDYLNLDNEEATWFIDPPYENGGNHYKHNKIDYLELAEWCKSRKGQVIVCENSKGCWLPFEPLIEITGQSNKSLECMWTNTNPYTSKKNA